MAFFRCVWSKFDFESPLVWSFNKLLSCYSNSVLVTNANKNKKHRITGLQFQAEIIQLIRPILLYIGSQSRLKLWLDLMALLIEFFYILGLSSTNDSVCLNRFTHGGTHIIPVVSVVKLYHN